ncbi:MAG TPA: putative Ig domain-containing protein, partial [Steroidobacteraceae bacterium]|nr:putative Ig domain-containing protein [Steroidobacteraceae bacterium]
MKGILAAAMLVLYACGGGDGGGYGGGGGGGGGGMVTAPAALSYTSPVTANVGTAITALTPTVTGSVTAYAVAPGLPAGLLLDGGTGMISGTPTATASQAVYTITASNAGGSTTFPLT